jgi:N-glycosylase/DNA lyase
MRTPANHTLMHASESWSPWQELPFLPPLPECTVFELLDGGQAFRWQRRPDGVWLGVWGDSVAQLRLAPNGRLQWRAPARMVRSVEGALRVYLAGDTDFTGLTDALPWRSDGLLAQSLERFRGLRLLRQPFGETLLGFLCSATKQIVQIKQMMALLAARHGAPLAHLPAEANMPAQVVHRLPTWLELATVPEKVLRECLLGFRAKYIHATALFLAENPGWLDATEAAPYIEAKARLRTLPGVGEKVADCVLLFGAGRMESFPVDVWILKTLATRYGLVGWKPAQVAQFGRAHFGAAAGLAQQFLFAHERALARR